MTEGVWMCLFIWGKKEKDVGSHECFFHTHAYVQRINHILTIPLLTSRQGQIQRDSSSFWPKLIEYDTRERMRGWRCSAGGER